MRLRGVRERPGRRELQGQRVRLELRVRSGRWELWVCRGLRGRLERLEQRVRRDWQGRPGYRVQRVRRV